MDLRTFNRAVGKSKMRAPAIAAAKAVLVDGWRPADAAAAAGISSAHMCQITRRVRRFANSNEPTRPPGWVMVHVMVPPAMAKAIHDAARRVNAEYRANWERNADARSTRADAGRSSARQQSARPPTSTTPASDSHNTPPDTP